MAGRTHRPEAVYRLRVNGHRLTGEKWHGAWTFSCDSWPELAEQHRGAADAGPLIEEFTRRALLAAEEGEGPNLFSGVA